MGESLLMLSICDNIFFLKTVYFIRMILDLLLFVIPFGLIIMIIIDLTKNVISGKEDVTKGNLKTAIRRIICCLFIFMVPTIVDIVMGVLNNSGNFNIEYKNCFYVTLEDIDKLMQEKKAECVGEYEWNDLLYDCVKKNTNTGNVSNSSGNGTGSSTIISNNSSFNNTNDLIYYNQGDSKWANVKYCSGNTIVKNAGCGATSLAIMASSFTNQKYNPEYVANWICDHGHSGGGTPWDFFTMQSMLNDFDLVVEKLFTEDGKIRGNAGKQYDSSKGNAILNAVKSGKGIILHIPGHYVVVGPNSKCNNEQVYLYDVGKKANNGCYTPSELFNKTYNYKDRCSSKGNCGWKSAFAYKGK